jgi:hypothetical protein
MRMKWILTTFCLLLSGVSFAQGGYRVQLKHPGFRSGMAYLTYHMGKNLNLLDSAEVNSQGKAEFKGKQTLPGGIYAVVFPGKSMSFDFLVDKEQDISISIDTLNMIGSEVTGSK